MKSPAQLSPRRPHERGAALVTVLLMSTLLLAASGALITTTSMTATTTFDATAESQAYVAAEAGLQDTLNVLRGNVAPSPLPTANPVGGVADDNKISFRVAVTRGSQATPSQNSSNKPNDAVGAPIRLSRWLNYNYTPSGGAYADRVTLTNGYTPFNGMAYSVEVSDPDNSDSVSFSTAGQFTGGTGTIVNNADGSATLTFPDLTGTSNATVTYTPRGATTKAAYPNAASDLGNVRVTLPSGSLGAVIPVGTKLFLTVNQSGPWTASTLFKGTLTGAVTPLGSTVIMTFTKVALKADGTLFSLNLTGGLNVLAITPAATDVAIPVSITAPDPKRLLVESTGYGPRNSIKQLRMLIGKSNFDFEAPATITLRGAEDCSPSMHFEGGSSGAKDYSGKDKAGEDEDRPAVAVSACDVDTAEAGIKKHDTVADPEIGILDEGETPSGVSTTEPTVPVETPDFLSTADKAREYLASLQESAVGKKRYISPEDVGDGYTYNQGNSGYTIDKDGNKVSNGTTPYHPFTFVDGDCTLEGGAGFLVVTGTLTMSGNPSFDGVVLVLGEGRVERNGGGNGNFLGALIVSAFERTWPEEDDDEEHPFLAPYFDTDGGGNSLLQFDSLSVSRAMNVFGFNVTGVSEF